LVAAQGEMLDNIEAQVGQREAACLVVRGQRGGSAAAAAVRLPLPSCRPAVQPCLSPPPPAPQVAKSVEYVQAGTTHLVAAKRLQKNTRKWMCCALILLLISAAAIAIPIAIKLAK
jgi:hypothetical protein